MWKEVEETGMTQRWGVETCYLRRAGYVFPCLSLCSVICFRGIQVSACTCECHVPTITTLYQAPKHWVFIFYTLLSHGWNVGRSCIKYLPVVFFFFFIKSWCTWLQNNIFLQPQTQANVKSSLASLLLRRSSIPSGSPVLLHWIILALDRHARGHISNSLTHQWTHTGLTGRQRNSEICSSLPTMISLAPVL